MLRRARVLVGHIVGDRVLPAQRVAHASAASNSAAADAAVETAERVLSSDASSASYSAVWKLVRSLQGSAELSQQSLQSFNNILFLVNSVPKNVDNYAVFNVLLRSQSPSSDLLPFLAQLKIPRNELGGTDYRTFIASLSRVQFYLPSWYYASLVFGRAIGSFDRVLMYAAQRLEQQVRMGSQVRSALAYPAFMVVLSVAAMVAMSASIIPQHVNTFEGMGLPLPQTLRLFLRLRYGVQWHWLALLVLVPWSVSARFVRFPTFMRLAYLRMHTPLGRLRFLGDKALLLHTLSLLDKEQINSKLLLVSANLSGNAVLQTMMEAVASRAKSGSSATEILAPLLEQKHVFSPYEIAYLQACLLSGKHSIIQDGLRYLSQMVTREMNQRTSSLMALITPVTTLFVGLLVVLIALFGVGPLVQLTSAVQL